MADPKYVAIIKQRGRERDQIFSEKLSRLDLRGADLSEADLRGADLSEADLREAQLSEADLREANLRGANLGGVHLIKANLRGADLSGANLGTACRISDPDGSRVRAMIRGHDLDLYVPEPSRSSSRVAYRRLDRPLYHSRDTSWALLRGADLGQANLHGAYLFEADLSEANLSGADLSAAILRGANLSGADLSEADLSDAILSEADLSKANLSGAAIGWTFFGDVNLESVVGLASVKHKGPSTIGIDTLQRSKDAIPDSFLIDCGVTDDWVEFIRPMLRMGSAVQFYSCFISYSHQDEEFSKRLHSRMRDDKLRVWYAPEDMKAGRKIHEQIDTAIRLHDKLLVVLSEESMASEWVKTEIRNAREREVKEGKRVLFPIRLVSFETIRDWKAFDADTGKDMAVEIREYFIPDFTNWKDHDAFEATYQRLMKDFKPAPDDK